MRFPAVKKLCRSVKIWQSYNLLQSGSIFPDMRVVFSLCKHVWQLFKQNVATTVLYVSSTLSLRFSSHNHAISFQNCWSQIHTANNNRRQWFVLLTRTLYSVVSLAVAYLAFTRGSRHLRQGSGVEFWVCGSAPSHQLGVRGSTVTVSYRGHPTFFQYCKCSSLYGFSCHI